MTPQQARALFVALLERARELESEPEFYNTATNNCTTNLIRPINELTAANRRVGRGVGLMPGYSYEAAYRRGWIDSDLPLQETRRRHYANDRIRSALGAADFSFSIRQVD